MGESSAIEWTDATWNPWRGCDKVSPGCAHCYMYRDQRRYGRDPGIVVRAAERTFSQPLGRKQLEAAKSKQPFYVFTCSWSDWFHPAADPWREEAWEIIRACPNQTFQILTKRPERMAEQLPEDWGEGFPNVWLGVSIENRRFVQRADILRATPAAVRFISAEPLLGPLVYPRTDSDANESGCGVWEDGKDEPPDLDLTDIDWLVVGGESGPRHRRVDPRWVRDLRDHATGIDWSHGPDALDAGPVAFFFKQWGGARPDSGGRELDGRTWDEMPEAVAVR